MPLLLESKNSLENLINIIQKINSDQYSQKIDLLANSSIGEHVRHIIELFQQLLNGYSTGIINYDDRKRDKKLQEDPNFAIESINEIILKLNKENIDLEILTIYNNYKSKIFSNYFRELIYNIEHFIHHQAIIKIGVESLNIKLENENFGMAKSTIQYKKECVQ